MTEIKFSTNSNSQQTTTNNNNNNNNDDRREVLITPTTTTSVSSTLTATIPSSSSSSLPAVSTLSTGTITTNNPSQQLFLSAVQLPLKQQQQQPSSTTTATIISNQNHHKRQISGNMEVNISVVSSQYENMPQYATPVLIKKANFIRPIYGILGFSTKNKSQSECNLREIGTLIMFISLLIMIIASATGFIVMWFTEVYNDQYTSKLVLSNNSVAVKWWMHPPISPHLKVHIFNYTNIDRYVSGADEKLKIDDLGPYVYAENATKVNVVFNNNHTITYKEHRSYTFIPQLSSGKQYDQVIVPNVPLLSAIASMKNEGLILGTTMRFAISSTKIEPFKTLAADSLLWGYDDDLISLSKTFSPNRVRYDKFGMLINRNGTSIDTFQIHTGEDDLRKLAVISQFNGKSSMDYWSTDECNSVDGTDGSQFPPYLIDKKKHLEVYIQALCRKLPLVFDSEVNVFDGVPAWRYKTPLNVFSHPNNNSDNQCYCHIESGVCPPSGVFNASKCYNAPIFVSFPHFFSGDPILYEDFDGIKPNASIHQTFADIHPRLAFPIDGASRIQINVQLHKEKMIARKLNRFKEGMILPVIWIEVTSGDLTAELRALIYHSSFSANAIQLALKYGTLLTFVTSVTLLTAICCYKGKSIDQEIEVETLNSNDLKILQNLSETKLSAEILATDT